MGWTLTHGSGLQAVDGHVGEEAGAHGFPAGSWRSLQTLSFLFLCCGRNAEHEIVLFPDCPRHSMGPVTTAPRGSADRQVCPAPRTAPLPAATPRAQPQPQTSIALGCLRHLTAQRPGCTNSLHGHRQTDGERRSGPHTQRNALQWGPGHPAARR